MLSIMHIVRTACNSRDEGQRLCLNGHSAPAQPIGNNIAWQWMFEKTNAHSFTSLNMRCKYTLGMHKNSVCNPE